MKVISHTKAIDQDTFQPLEIITISIGTDTIYDMRFQRDFGNNDIDWIDEFRQVYGQEFWEQVVLKLIERKELVKEEV